MDIFRRWDIFSSPNPIALKDPWSFSISFEESFILFTALPVKCQVMCIKDSLTIFSFFEYRDIVHDPGLQFNCVECSIQSSKYFHGMVLRCSIPTFQRSSATEVS